MDSSLIRCLVWNWNLHPSNGVLEMFFIMMLQFNNPISYSSHSTQLLNETTTTSSKHTNSTSSLNICFKSIASLYCTIIVSDESSCILSLWFSIYSNNSFTSSRRNCWRPWLILNCKVSDLSFWFRSFINTYQTYWYISNCTCMGSIELGSTNFLSFNTLNPF